MYRVFSDFLTDGFRLSMPVLDHPTIVVDALSKSQPVCALRHSMVMGDVTAEDIKRFINDLTPSFVKGQKFQHTAAFCGVVVSMDDPTNESTVGLLREIADLQVSEVVTVTRVAQRMLYTMEL